MAGGPPPERPERLAGRAQPTFERPVATYGWRGGCPAADMTAVAVASRAWLAEFLILFGEDLILEFRAESDKILLL